MNAAMTQEISGGPIAPRDSFVDTPFKTQTLAEWGERLPIGAIEDGRLVKEFSFKPFRFKEEREIERISNKPGITGSKFLAALLSIMLEQVHGKSFAEMKERERLTYIGSMWQPDVFYLYLYLRVQAIGNILPLNMRCGECAFQYNFDGDLNGVDVRVVEDPKQLTSTVTLLTGIPVRGERRKKLTIRPTTFNAFHHTVNGATARLAFFQHSVIGVDGIEDLGVLPETVFDELTKKDSAILSDHIERYWPGPQMVVKSECPRCASEWYRMLDTGYQTFFRSSSQ